MVAADDDTTTLQHHSGHADQYIDSSPSSHLRHNQPDQIEMIGEFIEYLIEGVE